VAKPESFRSAATQVRGGASAGEIRAAFVSRQPVSPPSWPQRPADVVELANGLDVGAQQQGWSRTMEDVSVERDDRSVQGDVVSTDRSSTAVCYDAARGVSYPKPRLRGVLHQVSFAVSLVAGPLLVAAAHGTPAKIAAGVYATSVTALFAVSALYHRIAWQPAARRRMQRLDHAMIFILIAGTYTPVLLLRMPKPHDMVGLCAVWGLALTGLVGHMCWLNAPERLIGGIYLGLGWLGVPALPLLLHRIVPAGLALVIAGGALYTLGALGYHRRWPNPVPDVLGFHEVFHTFVCAAVACHYLAIAIFVL
jgi:hemolysin III